MNTAGRLGNGFEPACAPTAAGSARGWPKLIGVESWWNEGKPVGRSSGKSSNTAVTKACNPNDVNVVQPRRASSGHGGLSVSANSVLSHDVPATMTSSWNAVAAKDTVIFSAGSRLRNKKGRWEAAFGGTSATHTVSSRNYFDGGVAGAAGLGAAGLGAAGRGAAAPAGAGAGTPDCAL